MPSHVWLESDSRSRQIIIRRFSLTAHHCSPFQASVFFAPRKRALAAIVTAVSMLTVTAINHSKVSAVLLTMIASLLTVIATVSKLGIMRYAALLEMGEVIESTEGKVELTVSECKL